MKFITYIIMIALVAMSASAHEESYDTITSEMNLTDHIIEFKESYEGKTFEELDNSVANMVKGETVLVYFYSSDLTAIEMTILVQTDDEKILHLTTEFKDTIQPTFIVHADQESIHKLIHSSDPASELKQYIDEDKIVIEAQTFVAKVKSFFLSIVLKFL